MTTTITKCQESYLPALPATNSYDSLDASLDLTREQADLVLRNTTDAYYNTYGLDNGPRLEHFQLRLAWMIGGTVSLPYIEDILTAWDGLAAIGAGGRHRDALDALEDLLNCAVNEGLSAAGISGKWINRSGS